MNQDIALENSQFLMKFMRVADNWQVDDPAQADAAARSPALRPYSSAEPQCCAPFNSEWPMLMRP